MTLHDSQKVIKKVKFSIFSPEMARKMSAAKIFVPDTYDDDGYPIEGGLVDVRLGVVDPGLRCKTCGAKVGQCPGHFGHIDLVRPVLHVGFVRFILPALKNTCPECHRLITTGSSKKSKEKQCPHCNAKIPTIKVLKPTTFYKDDHAMLPSEVKEWLAGIPNDDLVKLGFDPVYSRPEWMIVSVLLVPPVSTRPSITLETGERSEDDLTHKLVDIIRINQKLEANINAGAPQLIIEDLWELLQYHVTTFFDNETTNIPPARHRSGRPLKTIAQRLKGKEGRFRYNLSGKRVNFSARTVVSPDPRIKPGEVGIPPFIASGFTLPISVTEWNIDYCKSLILEENSKVRYVIRKDARKIKVTPELKAEVVKELKVGWVIEREGMNGDIVLFNRQPSLHRISMMGHEVKIIPGKTFRVNPLVIAPYNADFDGDEMNLHYIQSEEARAEARYLTKLDGQILSPRHGHAIIKPQEDHVSGIYFLTREGTAFTSNQAANMLYLIGIEELPKPDIKGGMYSGKLIFSTTLPKNLDFKSKSKGKGTVVIKKGKLEEGSLDSKTVTELLEKIVMEYGEEYAMKFLNQVGLLSLEKISTEGLTVSLRHYTLSDKAEKELEALNKDMERKIDSLIIQYRNKTLDRSPGMTLKETLESLIMQLTAKVRDQVGEVVSKDLGDDNPSIIMANIGSRGSLLNAVQMSALVSQQAVRNKRPSRGYRKRTLLFFREGDLGADARGYIKSSFRKGLKPHEFFHHAMGGRESLVNTAIRTARSGYMQRRLINALQDLVVDEKGVVKDAKSTIVQFIYGGDGKDPMYATKTELVDTTKQDDVDTAA